MADRHFTGITIDAEHSRDLDDAIRVEEVNEGWVVEVCVPLVSVAVPHNSVADTVAREIGFTRYSSFSVRKSMLDPALAERKLSLTPGGVRDVFVMRIGLDSAFAVRSFEFDRGQFESMARLSHEMVGEIFGKGSGPIHEMLARLWSVAVGLQERRRKSGSITWFSERSGFIVDEDGNPVFISSHHLVARAHLIVQEFMILANSTAAEWCVRNEVPIIFRNQRGNSSADPATLAHDLELLSESDTHAEAAGKRLNLMLTRAFLSRTAVGHFALGLPVYAWFSSPLRRYADLVNQRSVIAHLDGKSVSAYEPKELEELSEHLNALTAAQKEETSSFMLSLSEAQARRNKKSGRLSTLTASEMTAVIKIAMHSREFDHQLRSEIESRLSRGGLTDKDKGRLLLSRGEDAKAVQAILFEHIKGKPHEASTIINYLLANGEINPPSFRETEVRGVFSAIASLETERGTLNATGQATSKKAALYRASIGLLAAFAEFAWKNPDEWMGDSKPRDSELGEAKSKINAANPKGELINYCQVNKLPMPTFETICEGPPHKPSFTAVASVGIGPPRMSSSTMVAPSKKVAEQKAAASLLDVLMGKVEETAATPIAKTVAPQDNAKNALQEICQKRKWSLPTYETHQSGWPPVFTAIASVKPTDGNVITSTIYKASSKKAAEMMAAEGLITKIWGVRYGRMTAH
jgi:ribonuclease R